MASDIERRITDLEARMADDHLVVVRCDCASGTECEQCRADPGERRIVVERSYGKEPARLPAAS